MGSIKVTFTAAAVRPECRPSLPRSGACAAPLPPWHPHEVIMLGGYTEGLGAGRETRAGAPSSATPPPISSAPPGPATPRRAPTMEAWTFESADGGRWHPLPYAEGSPVPQPRLTSQAVVVGSELWLVGGWDPSAPPDTPQFLNDVWVLDLGSSRWTQVEVEEGKEGGGEELAGISRFTMLALPDGRLLLHTHRCDDHVLLLDPRVNGARDAAMSSSNAGTATMENSNPAQNSTRRVILTKVPVQGAKPGCPQSPASRGLHSLTAAAAPIPQLPQQHRAQQRRAKAQNHQEPATGSKAISGSGVTALYLYGGAPQTGPMFGDLWLLDTGSMTWRQLNPEGRTPPARCSHVAVACSGGDGDGGIPGRYLIFIGGSYYARPGQLQPLDDVIVYDTQVYRVYNVHLAGYLTAFSRPLVVVHP
ncbi:hypothetical protein Vretimale_8628 [Volvox reticuliferus]|uniref:Uncharacterized protein n=1 Tax=Volvox reticuliferus TaxID=1737510 RepID=A0A8J4CE13_9CHLO|nr:hypothetical protein Vretifemale_6444 [Volvox reticuliferus]GIM03987.1 hypothetical protein Vretimale_8628 [Volvox reticuliferus]